MGLFDWIGDLGSLIGGDLGSFVGDLGSLDPSVLSDVSPLLDTAGNSVDLSSLFGDLGLAGDLGSNLTDVSPLISGMSPSDVMSLLGEPAAGGSDLSSSDLANLIFQEGDTSGLGDLLDPRNGSLSDRIRSSVGASPAGSDVGTALGGPGSEPFSGLTADPLSSIPGTSTDWMKALGQGLQALGKLGSGLGGGAGAGAGGGAGFSVPSVPGAATPMPGAVGGGGPVSLGGAPAFSGISYPQAAAPQMMPMSSGFPSASGVPAQGMLGTPSAPAGGGPVPYPDLPQMGAFPAPRPPVSFSPLLIPFAQPGAMGMQQQIPMTGLQRLMYAG